MFYDFATNPLDPDIWLPETTAKTSVGVPASNGLVLSVDPAADLNDCVALETIIRRSVPSGSFHFAISYADLVGPPNDLFFSLVFVSYQGLEIGFPLFQFGCGVKVAAALSGYRRMSVLSEAGEDPVATDIEQDPVTVNTGVLVIERAGAVYRAGFQVGNFDLGAVDWKFTYDGGDLRKRMTGYVLVQARRLV